MPSKGKKIEVNPAVLRWARESAGVSPQELADRLNVTIETVRGWESGRRCPTLRALEKLANFVKRPLAVFFLPVPPAEPAFPNDFRVLPEEERESLSKKTRLIVRRSQRLQRIAGELEAAGGMPGKEAWANATLQTNVENLAARERERLGVSLDEQYTAPTDFRAFSRWRHAIENLGVLVFQFSMPVKEVRGFSLTGKAPAVIVVNGKDIPAARSFTLFHEYGHLMLDEGGVCLWEEAEAKEASPVEVFCNHFAGAFLVPAKALRDSEHLAGADDPSALDDFALGAMARKFHVSRHVVWRRMQVVGLISVSAYRERVASWQQRAVRSARPSKGRRPEPPQQCVQQRGYRFPAIVLDARHRNAITYRDVTDYLSLDLRHLSRLETILSGTGSE